MATYYHVVDDTTARFGSFKEVMAKATRTHSGDYLAEVSAADGEKRVPAQMTLVEIPTHPNPLPQGERS
jgi:ethanolamine ammonia-lyase large subunit